MRTQRHKKPPRHSKVTYEVHGEELLTQSYLHKWWGSNPRRYGSRTIIETNSLRNAVMQYNRMKRGMRVIEKVSGEFIEIIRMD